MLESSGTVREALKLDLENKDRKQGHWEPLNAKELPASGKNNCLFDAVSAYTGIKGSKLRTITANVLETNYAVYKNMVPAIQRLQQNKKSALYMGGVKKMYLKPDPNSTVPSDMILTVYRGDTTNNAHAALEGGINAKKPDSQITLIDHITDTRPDTPFISTTTDRNWARSCANYADKKGKVMRIEIPVRVADIDAFNNSGNNDNVRIRGRVPFHNQVFDCTHEDNFYVLNENKSNDYDTRYVKKKERQTCSYIILIHQMSKYQLA